MNCVIVILSIVATVCGIQYDGLRVKFGWTDALADMEYFFKIPRTIAEVENEGWLRTERPPGPLPELRMYCPPGRGVCPLYDTAGFVAGLMVAIPVEDFVSVVKPEKKFIKWSAPAAEGEPAKDYWTATQYFVSEDYVFSLESLKAGAGPQVENGATLQDGGVWVAGHDLRLMRIPSTEAELNSTTFKKQNCIPNMGTHYYYNMTRDLNCEELLPWFALTTQGDLVGTGFQVIGKVTKRKQREWFESIPNPKQSIQVTIPFAPDCLGDWGEKYGVISMHIYFVNDPWNIQCKSGDSIKPAPAIDRLLLNGYRYANQISDEVYKLFSG
ncbi:uncharacterized protein LOC110383327 isoform X1 [Helicoverpa armigera]|uniref:uncharacterized protein LOC124640081 isoform X1 n=1 Tax=Helicoverpa zea TaxID=7113 RepID=UPI000B369ED6|nr:uncharacterized protein LOC124640081 isoform X1 [Helicoverpa zea]